MAGPILVTLLLLATATYGESDISPTVCGECQECLTLEGRNYKLKNKNESRCDNHCLYEDDSGVKSGGVPEMCWCPTEDAEFVCDKAMPSLTWTSDNAVSCAASITTVAATTPGITWRETNNSYTTSDNCTDLMEFTFKGTDPEKCQDACLIPTFADNGCNAVNWNSITTDCQLFRCTDSDPTPTGNEPYTNGFLRQDPVTKAAPTTTVAPTTTAGITWLHTDLTFSTGTDNCNELHTSFVLAITLDDCMTSCLGPSFARAGCSAFNWKGVGTHDCVLLKCMNINPTPTGNETDYDGYALIPAPTAAPTTLPA